MKEPLVDIVDSKTLVTDACGFKHIDLYTVQVQDLQFKVPFSLKAARDDYIHAFLCHFDIKFSACHKPVEFSTGPNARYTHWKQTVFYIKDTLVIKEGEEIKGFFSLAPNKNNERDLDITINYELQGSLCQSKDALEYVMR